MKPALNEEQREAARSLELRITTSDAQALKSFDLFYRSALRVVDRCARELTEFRQGWHDDPIGDPEGYKRWQSPAEVQFDDDVRAYVALELFKRCERIRQENKINEQLKG